MQVNLTVEASPEGRLTGTVAVAGAGEAARPFSGNLELLACLEDLFRPTERAHHVGPAERNSR
ncbi:MAG TPA: hypothetical protein VGI86_08925 [Acidimicrobiia bacterium]|jgi:hypothetical protein